MRSMVFIVEYAPVGLVDGPRLLSTSVYLPENGYGQGHNNPPNLNKIYDPKRPQYPGWWIHMFVDSTEQIEDAFMKIQKYLLTNYGVKAARKHEHRNTN